VTLEALAGQRMTASPRATWSPGGREFLYQQDGKLMLFDAASRKAKELIEMKKLEALARKPAEAKRFDWQNRRVSESPIQWMPDGRRVLLLVDGDLFLLDTESRKFEQLTATPVAERDPKPSPDGRQIAFRLEHDLYTMEIASKKVTRLTSDGSENLLNGELDWVYPEELDLSTAYWWSPDSTKLAYLQFDTSKLGVYPHADLGGVTPFAEPQKYPKAGTANSEVRLGVVSATGGQTLWMQLGDTRERLLARVDWIPGTGTLFVQKMNRVQNRLEMAAADSATGSVRTVFTETDPHWINIADHLRFLPGRKQFLWSSERSGFRHLYLYNLDGTDVKRLTSGEWEVRDLLAVDEKAGKVYFTSTEASPLERQLYVVNLDGGTRMPLTKTAGTHGISMSPAADYYLDTHSSMTSPPRTTLHRADGTETGVFRDADRRVLEEYDLVQGEIHKVTSADGALLYGRVYKPAAFDASNKYPAIVMVYGGPHAQTITDVWQGLSMTQVLAHAGFVVWQLDNRGSSGRGHAWEARLYRRFGKQELEDQKTGVEYLVKLGYVDAARVGMHGWSYGGYMTLYSLLNAPDTFAAGVSGAPVTSWQHYDTIYTERYLGLPQENAKGYEDGSVIPYAKNLKGKLLLIHNFGDDNVLFQNSFQMAEALQKAGKQFDMMVYPFKSHGVMGYGRPHLNESILSFFTRTLKP
jgi:dipeptidyl-peptidase-4